MLKQVFPLTILDDANSYLLCRTAILDDVVEELTSLECVS